MEGAGLTQGAFYKQFASKDESGGAGVQAGFGERLPPMVSRSRGQPAGPAWRGDRVLSQHGASRRKDGRLPVVALGSDAARQGADVKASFEAGIREYLEMLGSWVGEADGEEPSGKAMAILSTMVGAMLLSRAVNDEQLSKRFLQAAAGAC